MSMHPGSLYVNKREVIIFGQNRGYFTCCRTFTLQYGTLNRLRRSVL